MAYEERYCAFVDILGFSALISTIGEAATEKLKNGQVEEVRKLLQVVHSPPYIMAPIGIDDYQANTISDAIAISAATNARGLLLIFEMLEDLSLELLNKGYFCRGAIVKGPLFHDRTMVFGEALIKAYRMESTVAKYPRVVVSGDVAADFTRYETEEFEGALGTPRLAQSKGEPFWLDVLNPLVLAIANKNTTRLNHFSSIRQQLVRRLSDAKDKSRHFKKVRWFARYWNGVMPGGEYETEGFEQLAGVGVATIFTYNMQPSSAEPAQPFGRSRPSSF